MKDAHFTDPLKSTFHNNGTTNEAVNGKSTEVNATDQCYATIVSDTEVLTRFKVILRSGVLQSIPYSTLPIITLIDNQLLIIKAHELTIKVTGRNLTVLEKNLSSERLIYLKESASGKDDGTSHVFIAHIEMSGKALNYEKEL
ncbi:hypothetical protein [Flavobacterium litorale]|uniref:Uncharacterized protein n=1 Tax=Flavobacterium litorale TaxID=2856519 RepID=A0ABX8V9K5_9FLAO|nr:hypothetical protein [Flavobacterium litorale]QYJ68813.1 hypothetical protein K1I41_02725 [Flavobacterium litorale]